MRLLHYAPEPLPPVLDLRHQEIDMKPKGLWVSVEGEDDWPSWCRSENFAVDRLSHVHEITLGETATILRLSTAAEIGEVTREYSRSLPDYPPGLAHRGFLLDWPQMATRYDGIIIAPYVWSCRLDRDKAWYYGWDCASGCIWNPQAIARHRLVPGGS